MDTEQPLARALRALQVYDELTAAAVGNRHLLIQAETILGEELGLECAGEEDGWNEDGTVAFYKHDGDTCPVHEWLVPDDHPYERSKT
jgi:hypothetical protein